MAYTISDGTVSSLAHRLLVRAQVEKDQRQLEDLIHDDFKGVETDGSIVTKAEEIEILMSTNFKGGEVTEEAIIKSGDLLIVIGTMTFSTEGPNEVFRFTDVFAAGKLISSHTSHLS